MTVLRRQAVLGPQTVFWIDNGNNDEGIRPSEIMPELSYKLVAQDADWGDGDGTKLEPGASLAGVGLTEMPQPAITKNEGNSTWQISYSNLPSTVVKNGSEYRYSGNGRSLPLTDMNGRKSMTTILVSMRGPLISADGTI